MSQTSYSVNMSEGKNGALYDCGDNDVMSYVVPTTGAAVGYGKLVVRNGTEGQCKLPAASTDVTVKENVLGFALAQQNIESDSSGDPEHPVGSVIPVLRKGRAYVKVEETVTEASEVYVRYAAGGNGVGAFGDTAGTSERALLDGARYVKGASANGLAVVEFNLPA